MMLRTRRSSVVRLGLASMAEYRTGGTQAKHTGITCGRPSAPVVARWPTRPVASRSSSVMRSSAPGHAISETSVMPNVTLIPIDGLPEIKPSDDLVGMLLGALKASGGGFQRGDVLALAQKVVSKAEGCIRRLADVTPGPDAERMAAESGKDPRALQAVLDETARIVRWQRGVLIVETKHGFVCANAGVDHSNAGAPDTMILLPLDPDASATRIRERIRKDTGVDVPVVITDTFGRAWREGHVNVAIGISGLPALRRDI